MSSLAVLYEDNHLLVVNKPAGYPTMGAASESQTMAKLAAVYLKQKYSKPGNVFVGVVSRLDSQVSGVLVLARTSKAASRLSEQFRERTTTKHYLAWIEASPNSQPSPATDTTWITLSDWLLKDEANHRMRIVGPKAKDAQYAQLGYRILAKQPSRCLLEIRLETGRKHQIRVQLAEHLGAILGDKKYAARTAFPRGIALHCHRLSIQHPTRDERLTFQAPPPEYWPKESFPIASEL